MSDREIPPPCPPQRASRVKICRLEQVRPNLALTKALWQKPACHLARLSSRERLGACCRSSVVEHSLGKGSLYLAKSLKLHGFMPQHRLAGKLLG